VLDLKKGDGGNLTIRLDRSRKVELEVINQVKWVCAGRGGDESDVVQD